MAPRTGSRHSFALGVPDELGRRFLSEREPYRFKEHTDTRVHVVAQGDTLEGLAGRYFAPLPRACGFWWVLADFQPDPIVDPTLELDVGRRLVVPSLRVLTDVILSEQRRRFDVTIVDRSGPGVRLTLLDNERAPSGEPLDLAGRIIAFTYEDAEKKADQVSLQLDNFDLALFERAELVGGATLEVSWGYPGNMAPPRRVVVKKLKGFQTLTIEGQATSVLMNREAKTRSWANKSRTDVVREIAAEHGYEGEFLDVEDTGEVLDTISQSAETDARFLRRLAAREEYEYFVDDTGFHWRSRDQASAPKHVLTWFSDPGRGDIISVSVESDLQRRAGRVEVRGRDPLAKTTVESAATSATVERATLSDVLEVVDRETGETSLQERNATTSVHPTSAPTPAAAERESAARFRRAERETVKLALQVVGDPTLRAKQVVEVRGISSLLSGKYYVTEAKHVISSSGYVVDLKLTRDGTGARRGAGPNARGQPQGGEPNRTTPATGTSTVTELERVDPETGRTVVEYRHDGNVVGVEDPEAGVSRMY